MNDSVCVCGNSYYVMIEKERRGKDGGTIESKGERNEGRKG